ncbi:MAG: hypothetical protein KKB50_00835 [Planctomycetes bacterium]|nr:hypothetical protein [Planctomycetota bacterium]
MINRWFGIITFFCMLSVNTALVFRDILPDRLAGTPPESDVEVLKPGEIRRAQVGIFDQRGRRVGCSWTRSQMLEDLPLLNVQSWTMLRPLPLPDGLRTPRVRVDTHLTYQKDVRVDRLSVRVHSMELPLISLEGEFMPPNDFPCQWQVGTQRGSFIIPAEATRALGDIIRPFDRLPGLWVGRTWRMRLINPVSQLFPGVRIREMSVQSALVRVTAREMISHQGEPIEAFRVEAENVVAWVTEAGSVLRQEVELPIVGLLTLLDEPFDEVEFHKTLSFSRED